MKLHCHAEMARWRRPEVERTGFLSHHLLGPTNIRSLTNSSVYVCFFTGFIPLGEDLFLV